MTKIVTDSSLLSAPCEPVASYEEGERLADELFEVLDKRGDGIGLAANQIGVNKAVCVLVIPDEFGKYNVLVKFINPKIVELQEPISFNREGCLSFPNQQCETLRYNKIKVVDECNPDGKVYEGLFAIAAYHEIDHLNGITMFQRKLNTIGPNTVCHCGSSKKFKKCCMRKIQKF